MSRLWLALPVVLGTTACLDLVLPPAPPPPGPGTLQGTLVYAVAGRAEPKPAGGARIQLVNSAIETTAALETGRFLLEGLTEKTGKVLMTFDIDRDGTVDRQRVIDFESVKAGPGRDVELGQLALGRNALVTGQVLLDDHSLPTGHAGTTVYVAGAPYVTSTADDGTFVLEALPEGPIQVSFYRAGYVLESRELELSGGEEVRVATTSLLRAPPNQPATSSLSGSVRLSSGAFLAGASVRAAADGFEASSFSNDAGAFTIKNLKLGVYQLAIEHREAKSLRLYNVSVGAEDTNVGVLTTTSGVSTHIELDGGLPLVDPEPLVLRAVSAPAVLELEPGTQGTLTGFASTGIQPLTYHWQVSDGGVGLTFTNNDSAQPLTQFTAPSTPQRLMVQLTVIDPLGQRSAPAASLVRVGRKPTARIGFSTAMVGSNEAVTLSGQGSSSSDSQRIGTYQWQQLTGPRVAATPLGALLQFQTPSVSLATPMTFQLIVTTELGIESLPVTTTIIVRPVAPWSVRITMSPMSPIEVFDGGGVLVDLMAHIDQAPPLLADGGDGFTYSWSPANSCPGPDGGFSTSCGPQGFVLSNTDGRWTQFVAPPIDRDFFFTVTATETSTSVSRSAMHNVRLVNKRAPTCVPMLSQLALHIYCDQPMANTGSVDAGFTDPLTLDPDTQQLLVRFSTPLVLNSLYGVSITGLTTKSGLAVSPLEDLLTVTPFSGPHVRSMSTSNDAPRAGWLKAAGQVLGSHQVVGRKVDNTNRMIWVMNPDVLSCTSVPCLGSDLAIMPIPGLGTPPAGTTVVNVGNRAYVGLSATGPVSVMEYDAQNNQWSELAGAPPFLSLGSDGTRLVALGLAVSSGLQRHTYDPTSKWLAHEIIDGQTPYALNSSASLDYSAGFQPTLLVITPTSAVKRFVYDAAAGWALGPQMYPVSSEVRAISLGTTSLVFTNVSGDLWLTGTDSESDFSLLLHGAVNGFDVVRWGSTALVAFAASGKIYAGLYAEGGRSLNQLGPTDTESTWNSEFSTAFLPGSGPRLTPLGDAIGLTWNEQDGMQWRMGARIIR